MYSWTLSDAWILAAVHVSRDQASPDLSYVIEAADGLNHALPTHKEIQQALARLCGCDMVTIEESALRVSSRYEAPVQSCVDRARGHFDIVACIHDWLCSDVKLLEALDADMLSESVIDEAERALRARRKQRRKS